MKIAPLLRRLTGLVIGISLIAPVGATSASTAPGPNDAQDKSSQDSARDASLRSLAESGGDPGQWDGSTNCAPGVTPFITGTVRDASDNPVAGAQVNVTILGLTFPNPSTNGPFRMWETKVDGTYSICSWGDQTFSSIVTQDQNSSNALLAIASPPMTSSGDAQGAQVALMTSFLTPQGRSTTPDSSSRSAACLDPALNTTQSCRLDFILSTPLVKAKVKQADGSAIPNAMTSLEYFFRPSAPTLTEVQRNALGKWVQLGFIPTNSTGDFGLSGFVSSNKFRLKVQAPECFAENGQTCQFDGYASQSDNFSVTVTNPSSSSAAWDINTQSAREFTLVPANFRAQITDGIGNDLYDIVNLNLSKGETSVAESSQYGGRVALGLANGTWSVEVVAPSFGAIGTNATYSVTVAEDLVTNVSRTSAPTASICSDATACATNLKLQLTPPNFLFIVKDSDGNVVEGADMSLQEYTSGLQGGNSPMNWSEKGNLRSGTAEYGEIAGLGGFTLDNGKIYKVFMNPPYRGNSDLVRTEYFLKVSDDGTEIRRCAAWSGDPQVPVCSLGWTGDLSSPANLLTKTDGRYTLTMSVANFRGFVCAPGDSSSCTTVSFANVNVQRWQASQCQGCTGYYQWIGMNAWSGESGTIALSFTTEGRYKMEVQPPNRFEGSSGALYAKNDIEFYADQVGNLWKFYTLDANGAATTTELPTATVASMTRTALRLKVPSLVGVVQSPGQVASSYSWVELRKETPTENCPNCSQWLGGASTDMNGVFALSLEVGKYVLTANPSFSLENDGLTRTELKISALDCDSDGSVEIYTYVSSCGSATLIPTVSGKVVITLQGANFSGVLTEPGTGQAVPSAQVDVEKWVACGEQNPCGNNSTGYWTWAGINDRTDQSGRFGFRLSEVAKYRVTFRSPSNLQSQFSSSRIEVLVTAGDPLQVTATADATVFSYNADTNSYTVKLKLPNISGTVTMPFDGDDAGSANDPAVNTWINVEKWGSDYCMEGCYQWSSEVNGANTNSNGDYGITLPAGRWRLTFNPPWGQSGVAKGTREIVVSASGKVCTLASSDTETRTTCPSESTDAIDLDVELPSPNFSGSVKNPDATSSQWSSIQFQKWDVVSNWWQWTNLWANTDNNGKFGINMTENGSYRVTFEPSWQAVGVSAKTIFIRVCDNGAVVELMANEIAAKTGTTCTGSGTLGDPLTVYTLIGANMKGIVIDGSSSLTLGDAWVAISNCGAGGTSDFCNWERGVNTKGFGDNKGSFAVNLAHTSGGAATKYKIEINPPWNTTAGLVRGQYEVWVKDFDNGSAGDEWCFATDYNVDAGTCSNRRNSESDPWSITLTAGNLAGKILAPTGDTGIAYASMQVEKWTQQPWNTSSYYWQWTNYWVNANQTGSFGLNIPSSDAGLFRITANPGWDNPNGFARRRMYIRVDASENKWCEQVVNPNLVSDETPYGTDGSGAECTEGTDNAADAVNGLTVRLSTSNLTGILYTSSTDLTSAPALGLASNKVRDAWMSLQVKRTNDWNGAEPGGEWTYWEWLGGSNTSGSSSSRGKFGFMIEENGEYRIDVQPSWRDTSGLDGQFYVTFTATSCGDGDGCTIELVGSPDNVVDQTAGNFAVKYPPPNFKGTVKDKANTTAIAGSWISIYKQNWEWVTGLSTGWNGVNAGKFGTKLDDGTYRVEVWPRWDDATSGMRRVITLVIAGGAVTSCNPGCELTNPGDAADNSRTITLRGENLSGKVYYPGATDGTDEYANSTGGVQTPMPWAWAEVRTCGDDAGTNCDWGEPGVEWVDSQGTNDRGLLRLGLDPRTNTDLPYLVTVWPNWSLYSASPLRMLVRVNSEGVATWRYESEDTGYVEQGTAFNPDFGRIPPNLTVTVTGVDDQRFVKLFECVGGTIDASCDDGTWTEIVTIGTVEISADTWKASFTVSRAADYKVVVLRTEADVTAGGTLPDATVTFSHDGVAPQETTVKVRP